MSLSAHPEKVLGVSPNTLCSGYPKHEKRQRKYYFFLNSGLLSMFKGFLLAGYQLYIIFSFFVFQIIFLSKN